MNKSNQNILGIYTYVDVLVDAIKKLRAEGFENLRVFSPVPNHEIEDALDTGKEPSKVKYFTFCGAILGALVGVCFTVLTSLDWPIVTSAKPIVSIPPYMIIIFECMILIRNFLIYYIQIILADVKFYCASCQEKFCHLFFQLCPPLIYLTATSAPTIIILKAGFLKSFATDIGCILLPETHWYL